jgi:hypothetical protein
MKRDTQNRPGVSKNAFAAPIGDPRSRPQADKLDPAAGSAPKSPAPLSVTLSARYIDSRLKQFCCR